MKVEHERKTCSTTSKPNFLFKSFIEPQQKKTIQIIQCSAVFSELIKKKNMVYIIFVKGWGQTTELKQQQSLLHST